MSRKSDVVRDTLERDATCGQTLPCGCHSAFPHSEPITATASDVTLLVTEDDGTRYYVFGEQIAVVDVLKRRRSHIVSVEMPGAERDPLFVGDPTFAKAAHHMGES